MPTLKWPEHFPESAFAAGLLRKRPSDTHIEKMSEIRRRVLVRLRAVDGAAVAGACYCDDEYLCAVHSAEFHRLQTEQVAGRHPWPGSINKLLDEARGSVTVPKTSLPT